MTTIMAAARLEMPAEIMTNIFTFALGNTVSADPTRLAISLVCKAWHRVLYENPSLWSRISLEFGYEPTRDLYINPVPTKPDWTFLRQALTLAHPHLLDIDIRFTRWDSKHSHEERRVVVEIFTILRMHAIRWHSLVLHLPDAIMGAIWDTECFETSSSPALERVVLRCCNRAETDYGELEPTTFGTQLRHLEINFHVPAFEPHWANLETLCIGFVNPIDARDVLTETRNLTALTLTHVGPMPENSNINSTQLTCTLDKVLYLCMEDCALLEMHGILRCPQLLSYTFFNQNEQRHSDHVSLSCASYSTGSSDDDVQYLIRFLLASDAHITTLDVGCGFTASALPTLLRYLSRDLQTFIGGRECDGQQDTNTMFLTLTDMNLVPRLSALELETDDDDLAFCPFLEKAIIARHQAGVLRRVHIERRLGPKSKYKMHSIRSLKIQDVYAASSLATTLVGYRQEGLDVQWIVGKYDVLTLARERMVTRF